MNIIKKSRSKLNITQKTLAIKCRVDQSYICKLEKFSQTPSINLTLLIGKKLHVCPSFILKQYICKKCMYRNNCIYKL